MLLGREQALRVGLRRRRDLSLSPPPPLSRVRRSLVDCSGDEIMADTRVDSPTKDLSPVFHECGENGNGLALKKCTSERIFVIPVSRNCHFYYYYYYCLYYRPVFRRSIQIRPVIRGHPKNRRRLLVRAFDILTLARYRLSNMISGVGTNFGVGRAQERRGQKGESAGVVFFCRG